MKRIALVFAAIVFTSLLLSPSAKAALRVWANSGTDYNLGTSWTGGTAPGDGDVGQFNAAPVTQPNISLSLSNAGVFFSGTGTSGYLLNATTGASLTLTGVSTSGSSGTSNSSAAAIRGENTSGANTINAPLILAPATGTQSTFVQAAGGTLNVNGNISSAAGINLSLRGGGTIYLGGNNSFATSSIDTSGETVILGTDTALGSGTFTVGNTATLQSLGARTLSNAVVVGGNTTVSGNSAFTFNGAVTSSGSNSRSITVSNIGGAVFNGTVSLEEAGAPANRMLTFAGTTTVVINGAVQNGDTAAAGLRYSGSSTLTLANTNTYTGGTLVGGNVTVTHDGGLGIGNVSLTAASVTLTLQGGVTNNYIGDSANVNIQLVTGTVNLNFTGTDVVGSLTVANTQEPAGIYGSATSGAPNVLPEFTGNGTITVLTQIPEPATYMLMGLGLLVCAQQFRCKRA